jgi:hypothetical protein
VGTEKEGEGVVTERVRLVKPILLTKMAAQHRNDSRTGMDSGQLQSGLTIFVSLLTVGSGAYQHACSTI